jgi:hypothetical protein
MLRGAPEAAVPSAEDAAGAVAGANAVASGSSSDAAVVSGGARIVIISQPAIATTAMLRPTTSPCDSRDGFS